MERAESRATAALLVMGIVLLAALVVFVGLPNTSKFMHVLHKAGHPVVFGIIAVLVLTLVTKHRSAVDQPKWFHYLVAFGIAVAIGALTELAQLLTHRGAAIADVLSDALGAAAGLAWHSAISSRRVAEKPARIKLAMLSLALLLTIVALAPLFWSLAAYAERDTRFPVILQNPSARDMYFVTSNDGNLSLTKTPHNGESRTETKSLRVALDRGRYPGMQITEPFPAWRGYRKLAIDMTNPGGRELEIVIRVHDRQHHYQYEDRFNRSIVIGAGVRTTIEIPLLDVQRGPRGRLMNLDAIANIAIFALQPVAGGEFIVHRIWLL